MPPLLFTSLQSKLVDDVTKHAKTTVSVTLPPLPFGTVTVPENVPLAGGGLGGGVGGVGGVGGLGGVGDGGAGGGFPTCPGKINSPETVLEPPPVGGGGVGGFGLSGHAVSARASTELRMIHFFMLNLPLSRPSKIAFSSIQHGFGWTAFRMCILECLTARADIFVAVIGENVACAQLEDRVCI